MSQTLLAAALAGLLCAAPAACSTTTDVGSLPDAAGEDTGPADASGSSSSGSPAIDASTDSGETSSSGDPGDAGHVDASLADAAADAGPVTLACADGVDPAPHVTASTTVPDLTLDAFTAECDQRGGVVAIEPHCGGSNACRGFFYDTATHVRTEHTCRGTNTCAGYSCIDCED